MSASEVRYVHEIYNGFRNDRRNRLSHQEGPVIYRHGGTGIQPVGIPAMAANSESVLEPIVIGFPVLDFAFNGVRGQTLIGGTLR
jgi:hypothetical protein